MKEKGFTLIELLAVIVILAIIALIATPIILNIIGDTKNEALKRSAENYMMAVETAIVKENLKEEFNPTSCTINSIGNLDCDGKSVLVEVDGEKPTGGTISFANNKIASYQNIKMSKKLISKQNGELIIANDNSDSGSSGSSGSEGGICVAATREASIKRTDNGEPVGKIVGETASKDTLGAEYICNVNDEKAYHFYVLSKDQNKVNLIMAYNIDIAGEAINNDYQGSEDSIPFTIWGLKENDEINTSGPVSAIEFVNTATSNWNNITNLNEEYADEKSVKAGYSGQISGGYNTIALNGKARLPKMSEVLGTGCQLFDIDLNTPEENAKANSCPLWMVNYTLNDEDYLYDGMSVIGDGFGYWLLTSDGSGTWGAWNIASYLRSLSVYKDNGIRPVITVGFSDLS